LEDTPPPREVYQPCHLEEKNMKRGIKKEENVKEKGGTTKDKGKNEV
jgi:hypothetical protein